MKVNCELAASDISEHIVSGKYVEGAEKLIVKNAEGYRAVTLQLDRFNGSEWKIIGEITVDGGELEKAIHNAMND